MTDFKIYYTSDVHGYLMPTDYISSDSQSLGLANVAANYHKDENTIVIDGGDMFQGSPMLQYLQQHDDLDAVATAMNIAGYDFVTLGNHDFNYGYQELEKHLHNLDAVVVAENVTDLNGVSRYPAQIKELPNGTKLGIIGLVTDYINVWENPEHLSGVKIESPLKKAKTVVDKLRESVDIVVGVYHGGYERDLNTGELLSTTKENIAYELTETLDLDILLTGHQHGNVMPQVINNVLTLQMPNQGKMFAEIIGKKNNGQWEISATTKQAGSVSHKKILEVLSPLENKVHKWLDQPIAHLINAVPIQSPLHLAQYGNDILQLIAHVELEASKADLALVSLNNNDSTFPQKLTLRHILQNYPFDNTLVIKKIFGKQLKESLEHTAEYFKLSKGELMINDEWLVPKVEHYNYDLVYGLSYTIDVTRPVGNRITNLLYKGNKIEDTDSFSVAMNSYRAVGGGDYQAYAEADTIYSGDQTVQDMLINYFKTQNQLPKTPELQLKVIY
ncbi:bifunctional metallophosphatase/5'-nucleotidase [Leuconostoc palmae]|uniref:bifunctional metallophosphatase/5'-nucleotidase n=1 Tax=Leuconostoc palmae TaxID=501487 RepID=UPI001C7DC9E9|nr:bifunctional UDP-sugar hydrolase/5'-nucleotidase [Leuconostoc palmae]